MREIRFRGKGLLAHKGEWIYGFFKKNTNGDCYIENEYGLAIIVDPETVGQLVCRLQDGSEIYEGDYLEDENGDPWVVEYDAFSHAFNTASLDSGLNITMDSEWIDGDPCVSIIGNRWDGLGDFNEEEE